MKKIKYSNIFLLGIFIYIIFQISIYFIGKNVSLQTVENEKYDAKLVTKGLVVRDEYVVKSNSKGNVDILVKDMGRVKKSQNIATVYKNNTIKENTKEVQNLNEEIDKIKSGEDNISKDDIKKLNEEINKETNKIQKNLIEGVYSGVSESKDSLKTLIEKRNKLIFNGITQKGLETKETKRDILNEKIENNVSNISTKMSGVISYIYDEKEAIYTVEALNTITKSDIENSINEFKELKINELVNEDDALVRIINTSEVYVAISIAKNKSNNFKVGNTITVGYGNQKLTSKVEKNTPGEDNNIVILKIKTPNSSIFNTRVEEFDIIYKQVEGLKVDKNALQTVGKEKGVYVVDEEINRVKFVKLENILYEDDNFIFIDYYKNKQEGIKSVNMYDRVLLKPNMINKNIKVE